MKTLIQLVCLLALSCTVSAQCEAWRLEAPDGEEDDYFGESVSISGDWIAVGAWRNKEFTQGGAVYMYRRDAFGWHFEQKLLPNDIKPHKRFGEVVSLDGDRLAVSAVGDGPGTETGAVYVFERHTQGWTETAKIEPASAGSNNAFGDPLSLSEGVLFADVPGLQTVLVFEETAGTWQEVAQLPYPGGSGAIALDGDIAAVGTETSQGAGQISIAEKVGSTWTWTAEFIPSDSDTQDSFGVSAALSGERLVVGDPAKADSRGRAYVFERVGGIWTEQAVLAPAASSGARFGAGVGILGDRVFGSMPYRIFQSGPKGAVIVFDRIADKWVETELWRPRIPKGESLDADGARVVVGNRGAHNGFGKASGAASVLGGEIIGPFQFCDATANSSGMVATIDIVGSLSISTGQLELQVDDAPSKVFGIFLHGPGATSLPWGDGHLCVDPFDGGFHRLVPVVKTNTQGTANYQAEFDSIPGGPLLPGTEINFQFWFRDTAAGGAGFNLSTAVHVSFCP